MSDSVDNGGSDGAAGGFADAGSASESFDGSVSASAGDYSGGSTNAGGGGPGGDSSGGVGGPSTADAQAAGGSAGMGIASAAAAIGYAAMGNPIGAVMALMNTGYNFSSAVTLIEYSIGQVYATDPQAFSNAMAGQVQ